MAGIRSLNNQTPIMNSWAGDGTFWYPKSPPVSNYWYVTYASVFGDDPSALVKRMISQLNGVKQPPATGGFVTGAASIDGIAAAVKLAKGSTNGAVLAAIMQKFKGLPTISGKVSFSPTLHSVFGRAYRVMEVQNSKPKFVQLYTAKKLGTLRGVGRRRLARGEPVARGHSPGHRRFARFRRRARTAWRGHRAAPARSRRPDRPERRREDDPCQRHHRIRLPDCGLGRARRGPDHVVEPSPPGTRGARPDVPAQPVVRVAVRPGERRGGRARLGGGSREARRRTTALLELLGLEVYRARPAGTLAHGDERKLGVARALATAPRFVLMDEPAAGLPEAEVPEFAAVVNTVRDAYEAGVLLIDHNMALIMEVCDRIHVLDQGRTLAEGTPQEIRSNLDVTAAYLGESAVHEASG